MESKLVVLSTYKTLFCKRSKFVVDQLDTHKSAKLVELIAWHCEIDENLGTKGKDGILKSMKTRRAFPRFRHDHRINIPAEQV